MLLGTPSASSNPERTFNSLDRKEKPMPYVHIQVTDEGVSREQKQELITATTNMLRDVLGKNPKSTFVVIEEVPTDNWGVGGELVTNIRSRKTAQCQEQKKQIQS
jgi:4-oxalocrotonate tautomerase